MALGKEEAVLLQVHYDKAEFFEKDNNVGKKRRKEERKSKTNKKWIDSMKEAVGMSP